jgi:MerR family Zn(II)-responsive transcriptional regulator of zntA
MRVYTAAMDDAMPTMTVGRLAQDAGINIETVRFYEREGLLPKPERSAGGHRLYCDDDVSRLRFIARCKDVGFTLKEIHELLYLRASDLATCGDVLELAEHKLDEIKRKIEMLGEMRDQLSELVSRCQGGNRGVECCNIIKGLESDAKPRKSRRKAGA